MLLYHSVIFPAPSRFFEYKGAEMAHKHHMGKRLLSHVLFSAFTKTFCLRKVLLRTLASHPAKMGQSCFYLYPGWAACVCGSFYTFIMIQLLSEPTGRTMCDGVGCQRLVGRVTWLSLDPSGPLIPKEWFSCWDCFNWFFCDLKRDLRQKTHYKECIKDFM